MLVGYWRTFAYKHTPHLLKAYENNLKGPCQKLLQWKVSTNIYYYIRDERIHLTQTIRFNYFFPLSFLKTVETAMMGKMSKV